MCDGLRSLKWSVANSIRAVFGSCGMMKLKKMAKYPQQKIQPSRSGCNPRVPWAGSLSLSGWAAGPA